MFSRLSLKYKLIVPIVLLGFVACFGIFWTLIELDKILKLLTQLDVAHVSTFLHTEFSKIVFLQLVLVTTSAVIFILISFRSSKKVNESITQIKHAMDVVAAGNYNEKLHIEGQDELSKLGRKINEVIMNLMVANAALTQKTEDYANTFKQLEEKNSDLEKMREKTEGILKDLQNQTERLMQENIKNEAILTNMGDGLVITDKMRIITLVNAAAEKMLGLSADTLLGKQLNAQLFHITDELGHEVIDDELPIVKAIAENKSQKTSITNAYYFQRANGIKFPVAITASPIVLNKDVTGSIFVFRDITNDKEVDKAKTEFVSLASHQLRTPLTSINWYTEMILAGDAGKTTDKQLKYLSEIYRGSQRMVNLVNSLLNASRIELGTLKIIPEKIDLRHVMDSVLNELTLMIDEKKLKVIKNYKDIKEIDLDPNLIRVVFQNVMSNAVIYSPEAGTVTLGLEPHDNYVLATIQDTGYGIPLEQQDMIFTKLFRADNVQQLDTNGSGLGLYISKSIIEQANGKIWFDSQLGKGSTFFISVPYKGMKQNEGVKGIT